MKSSYLTARYSLCLLLVGLWSWNACTFPNTKKCDSDRACQLDNPSAQYYCDIASGERDGICKPKCTNDVDCAQGESCQGSKCAIKPASCNTDTDCKNGQTCTDKMCQPKPACTTDADCNNGQTCADNKCIAKEICTIDGGCHNDQSCPNDSCTTPECTADSCSVGDTCTHGSCETAPECTANSCPSGQICNHGKCEAKPGCTTNSDCTGDQKCLASKCVAKDACMSKSDCPNDQICTNAKCEAKPGCTANSDCPNGQICQGGKCIPRPCKAHIDCHVADICNGGLCTPNASPVSCSLDRDCSDAANYCEAGTCIRICQKDTECSQGLICSSGRCQKAQITCATATIKMPDGKCIESGSFLMGAPAQDQYAEPKERPQHTVHITHRFVIGKYEVRYDEFLSVLQDIPLNAKDNCLPTSKPKGCPLNNVTWHQAARYANELTKKKLSAADQCFTCTGSNLGSYHCELKQPYTRCLGFRLPTEAEWEYAARAGSTSIIYTGNISGNPTAQANEYVKELDEIAWYDFNSSGAFHSVGEKMPNAWGLYDMLGNLREWVADIGNTNSSTDNYPGHPRVNPLQLKSDNLAAIERALRGCHNGNPWNYCRTSHRQAPDRPELTNNATGFRIVRTLPDVQQ